MKLKDGGNGKSIFTLTKQDIGYAISEYINKRYDLVRCRSTMVLELEKNEVIALVEVSSSIDDIHLREDVDAKLKEIEEGFHHRRSEP